MWQRILDNDVKKLVRKVREGHSEVAGCRDSRNGLIVSFGEKYGVFVDGKIVSSTIVFSTKIQGKA
jgi:hypothetical protein